MNISKGVPSIVCWNEGNKRKFYRYELLKYIECGKHDSDNIIMSGEKINNIYHPYSSKYISITHKDIHKDIFDETEKNYIIINCLEFKNVLYYLKNISDDICNFAKKHNLKIFLLYIEHPLHKEYVLEFDEYYKTYYSLDSFKSKNIKVIVNSFDRLKETLYPDAFIYLDTYSYVMRVFFNSDNIEEEYPFIEKRKYDFSLLAGSLTDRFERVVVLNHLFENNFLDEKFFYTVICNKKSDALEGITSHLQKIDNPFVINDPNLKNLIQKNMDLFLENKIYDQDGTRLKDIFNIIYDNNMDYKIPIQVRQSCINILFETKLETPSITEKMYKPIVAGIPFVWYGPVNCSKYLISKGYKMYPFIDYSFDFVEDTIERMYALLSEIKRLKDLGSEELQKKIIEYKDISIYNQKTFIENTENLNELYKKIIKCI